MSKGGGGLQFFNDSSKNPTKAPYLVKNERSLRNAYFASFHLRLYSEKWLRKLANLIQGDTFKYPSGYLCHRDGKKMSIVDI